MRSAEKKFLCFLETLVKHPGKWLVAWLLVIGLTVTAVLIKTDTLNNIVYHNGPYLYFTEDNPEFRELKRMESIYATESSLIFIYAPKQGDIFNQQSLHLIETLTEKVWSLPYVLRVDSIANFQHTEIHQDDLTTDYLYRDALSLTPPAIARLKQITLNEPSLLHQSISPDGKTAAIVARINIDEAQTKALELMPKAEALVTEFTRQYPQAQLMLLGDAPYAAATDDATQHTFRVITPISMTLVFICLIAILRNISSVIACQLVISFSILLGYCLFILADFNLSPISAGASPIIMTLAVADTIHILISYQFQCAQGKTKQDAMLESLRLNFSPVWLTSITTAIGFLFMNFAEAPPFHDLGNAVFFGVMMAFLLSTFMLPPLMMLMPKPKTQSAKNKKQHIHRLALFTIHNRRTLLAGMSVIILLLSACIPLNRINDIFLEYFDDSFAVRRALDFYYDNMGGLQRLQFSVPAATSGGVTDPDYLTHLDELVEWAEQHPQVSHVRSFTQVVKRLNRDMHGGDQDYYEIPNNAALISQYLLLYELGLPFGLGLDTQVDIQKSETKLEIIFNRLPSDELVAVRDEVNQWIKQNWPDYMQVRATGLDSLFSDISFENVKSMIIGTALALVTVSLLLVFSLGSLKYGLLSLIPNLLPAAMTFGVWAIIHGELGIVVSVIACMTLGIIVDDTVHFLSKYVRAKRELGLDHNEAAIYAFETVGVALIATSVILIANFIVMAFSHYYPNASTGILTSITIGFALLIDFFFFVPLLLTVDGRKPLKASQQNSINLSDYKPLPHKP